MSLVRDFYRDHHISGDTTHKLLDQEHRLRALLPDMRQAALSCCTADRAKDGSITLAVVDAAGWDEHAKRQQAIQAKLDVIDEMVAKLDTIFAEIQADGVDIAAYDKTVRGIHGIEASHRIPGKLLEYLGDWRGRTHEPAKSIPKFVAWSQRAEAALDEANTSLEGGHGTPPSQQIRAVNPLAELAGKAKSLFG